MRKADGLKLLKKMGWLGLGLSLTAFSAPQKGDLFEITAFLNGRSEARFRAVDKNKVLLLKKNTRGIIKETKQFRKTGNYGLCIEIHNAVDVSSSDSCVWVYYNVQNPAMNVYSGMTNETTKKHILEAWAKDPQKVKLKKASSPASAEAIETTRDISAIAEKKNAVPENKEATSKAGSQKVTSAGGGVGADVGVSKDKAKDAAKSSLQTIDRLNKTIGSALVKQEVPNSPSCPDGNCNRPVVTGDNCSANNRYLENSLSRLLEPSSQLASFFRSPQKSIISNRCIKANMTLHGEGKRYQCNSAGVATRVSAKACVSDNKLNLISKSFNLSADCFGDLHGENESAKQQSALAIFSLMAQESGMHMNVVSPSGAAGVGQLTNDAINEVNSNRASIQKKLKSISGNPNCSRILSPIFNKPMSTNKLCDRIGTSGGNPLKNIAYSFAYQNIVRSTLDRARFGSLTFKDVVSPNLDPAEEARLKSSLVAWGHNTGPGGLLRPLGYLMRHYSRTGKSIRNAKDVDQFLSQLSVYMRTHPHSANSRRRAETSNYFKRIQSKVREITKEPKSCLVN